MNPENKEFLNVIKLAIICQLNSQGPFTFFTMGVAQKKRKVWYISVYMVRRMPFFPCFGLRSDPNQLCYGTDTFVFFFYLIISFYCQATVINGVWVLLYREKRA